MFTRDGINMYLEQSQAQAVNVSAMVRSQLAAYDSLQLALDDFVASAEQLKGRAYDSARDLISQVLEPLRRAGVQLSEMTEQLVNQLPEDFVVQVGGESLEEMTLREEIRRWDSLISEAEDMLAVANMANVSMPNSANAQRVVSLENSLQIYQAGRDALQGKLDRLLEFNQISELMFAEIADLERVVNIGLSQFNDAWDEKTETFKIPNDLTWTQKIKERTESMLVFQEKEAV